MRCCRNILEGRKGGKSKNLVCSKLESEFDKEKEQFAL